MKIMFCTGKMTKGGAERVIANLCNGLVNKNDISIVVNPTDAPAYSLDKKIHYYSLDEGIKHSNIILRNIYRITRLRQVIKDFKPDVIVSFLPTPSSRVLLASLFSKTKIIVSVRNDPKREYGSFLRRLLVKILFPRVNGFVFQTDDAKEYFSDKIKNRSIVIPNPINEDFICDDYHGERLKEIVAIGRLVEQKNHALLISAFNEVSKKHNDYVLKIYGDGPLKESLEQMIKEYKLEKKVLLMGETSDIKKVLYKAGMFVLSSDYEGMPNALMEAMTIGVPCISTDCPCGGPKYLISNKKDGLLFEVGNCKQLIDCMNYYIENSKKASLIGKNAKQIVNTLSPRKVLDKWEEYIYLFGNNHEKINQVEDYQKK